MISTPTKPLRAGVIGCGSGGMLSVRALSASPEYDLVAVSDLDDRALERCQRDFPSVAVFTDHRPLLESMQLDVACVSTWAESHPQIARECVDAGIRGMLVEKPLALTYDDASSLVELLRRNALPTVVPHGLLVRSTSVEILRRLRQREIGEIKVIEIQCSGWDLINAGIHWIDFALAALGEDRVCRVLAACDTSSRTYRDGVKVETDAITYAETKSGVRIIMRTGDRVDVSREGKGLAFRFYGDLGSLEFWGWEDSYRIHSPQHPSPITVNRPADPESSHQRHLERLALMIAEDAPDFDQVELSLAALEVCHAAYLSHRTRRMVQLPLGVQISPSDDDWDAGTPYRGEPGQDGRRL